jgi:glutathione S-transferase
MDVRLQTFSTARPHLLTLTHQSPEFYAYASSAWLALQSVPLMLAPKLIIGLLARDDHTTSDPELYLSRLLALALLSIAAFTLLSPQSPYPLTLFHTATFIYIYVHYTTLTSALGEVQTNTTGLILGLIGYGFLTAVGIWVIVFSGAAAHVSKRTGADKRTSGWPFGNVHTYNPKVDRKMGKQT